MSMSCRLSSAAIAALHNTTCGAWLVGFEVDDDDEFRWNITCCLRSELDFPKR